jgi:hypothetical protein
MYIVNYLANNIITKRIDNQFKLYLSIFILKIINLRDCTEIVQMQSLAVLLLFLFFFY